MRSPATTDVQSLHDRRAEVRSPADCGVPFLHNAVPAAPAICTRRTARWVRSAPHKRAVERRQGVLEKSRPAVCAETHSEAPFVQWLHSLGRAAAHQAGPHRAHRSHRGRRPHDLCAAVYRLHCSAPRRPSPSFCRIGRTGPGGHRLQRRRTTRWRHVPCVCQSRPSASTSGIRRPFVRAGANCGWAWRPMPSYTPFDRGRERPTQRAACACRQPPRPRTASKFQKASPVQGS